MSTCRACFVPMCSTGYNSSRRKNIEKGESNKSLFKTPKDTALFQKWQRAIPKTHNLLTSKNVVCELHFLKEDVLRFYETKMPDGTIDKIERGRPKLRDGAVPCIFPNLPSYYTKIPRKRKSPTRRAQIPKKIQKVSPMSESVIEIPSSSVLVEELLPTVSDINDEQLDPLENNNSGQSFFQQLKDNLSKVATPNDDWSGTFIRGTNEIVFAEWNDTYTARKRVIIKCDMSVKVLFGNTEISRDCIKKIVQDFEEVENLLKTVHHLIACRGIRTIRQQNKANNMSRKIPQISYCWCISPTCANTSIKTPEKTFINVPTDEKRRKQWFIAVRREYKGSSKRSKVYVCEDHFNLETDMENYMKWKMTGCPKIMKKDAVPHMFDCELDEKQTVACENRSAAVKRKRKQLIKEEPSESFPSVSTSTLSESLTFDLNFEPSIADAQQCTFIKDFSDVYR